MGRDVHRVRYGLFNDGADLRLCILMMAVFIIDLSQLSYWAGPVKPLGEAQRWLTVMVQAGYIGANASRLPRIVLPQAPLLGLIGFCALSCLWSVNPAASLLGAVRLLLLAGSLLLAQERHGAPVVARIFLVTCSAILVVDLSAIALPGLSFMSGSLRGSFRGFTDHKNSLGAFCGLTVAFLLAAPPEALPRRHLRGLFLLVLLVTVALTRSATSLVLCAAAFSVFAVARAMRRTALPVLIGVLAAGLFAALGGLYLLGALDVFALLGRDTTLTGRSQIWQFVGLYVQERPWFGYGYRAFALANLLRADPRWGTDSFIIGSTHNAYLAIVTEIGLAGLAAYFVWLAVFVVGGFPRRGKPDRALAATVLGVYLVSGLTESLAGLAPGLYFASLLVAFHGVPRRDAVRISPSARSSGDRPAARRAG